MVATAHPQTVQRTDKMLSKIKYKPEKKTEKSLCPPPPGTELTFRIQAMLILNAVDTAEAQNSHSGRVHIHL